VRLGFRRGIVGQVSAMVVLVFVVPVVATGLLFVLDRFEQWMLVAQAPERDEG
jgi:hypothetical protein